MRTERVNAYLVYRTAQARGQYSRCYNYTKINIITITVLYNYSTCCTNRVPTRFDTPSTRLRVRFAYASGALLKHQLRGEVRQYIDHVAHLNTIDSHHRLKEHTILYVFRAPRHDLLMLLNQYEPTLISKRAQIRRYVLAWKTSTLHLASPYFS